MAKVFLIGNSLNLDCSKFLSRFCLPFFRLRQAQDTFLGSNGGNNSCFENTASC